MCENVAESSEVREVGEGEGIDSKLKNAFSEMNSDELSQKLEDYVTQNEDEFAQAFSAPAHRTTAMPTP